MSMVVGWLMGVSHRQDVLIPQTKEAWPDALRYVTCHMYTKATIGCGP